MDAKTLSEVVKNWASSIAVFIGIVFTLIKGPGLVEEKQQELRLQNQSHSVKIIKKKIEILNSLEKTINAKEATILQEKSKDFYKKDMEAVGQQEKVLLQEREKQKNLLNDIKLLLEKNLK